MLDPRMIEAYDVRGIHGSDLDEDGAYRVGRAYVEQFGPRTIAVGRDMRVSSESMAAALRDGSRDGGADGLDTALVDTEMLYFAVGEGGLDRGNSSSATLDP